MKVNGQEIEAEHSDGKLGLGGNQQLKERRVIAVFVKDRCTPVSTVQHMVGMTGNLSASNSGHGTSTVAEVQALPQGK
jgi:hypothetical protein